MWDMRNGEKTHKCLNAKCENIDLASIATLPTEVGDGLEEQDTYFP